MSEVTYTISQAAKILKVESHVLRFWEEELELKIGRNAKGYRVYTKENIETMQKIKELKKNHALKDIRDMLGEKEEQKQQTEDDHKKQFFAIMEKVIQKTLEERNGPESRYKAVDQAIRERQQARKLVAAARENQNQKRESRKRRQEKRK